MKIEVPAKRVDLKWMRSVVSENNSEMTGIGKGDASSLLKKIDQAAKRYKISEDLVRVEPVGKSGDYHPHLDNVHE